MCTMNIHEYPIDKWKIIMIFPQTIFPGFSHDPTCGGAACRAAASRASRARARRRREELLLRCRRTWRRGERNLGGWGK